MRLKTFINSKSAYDYTPPEVLKKALDRQVGIKNGKVTIVEVHQRADGVELVIDSEDTVSTDAEISYSIGVI